MRVNTVNTINRKLVTQNDIKVQKTNSNIKFRGVTIGPTEVYEVHTDGYSGHHWQTLDGYTVPSNATANYEGAYPNENTKIYRADPFEIIPEHIYRTHDYTIRDDLRLSQIQNDYKNGRMNFAQNAINERNFIQSKIDETKKQIDHDYELIDKYTKELNDVSKCIDEKIREELTEKKQNCHDRLSLNWKQMNILQNNLENANERYMLLFEMDELAIEKEKVQDSYNNLVRKKRENEQFIDFEPSHIKERLKSAKYSSSSAIQDLTQKDEILNKKILKCKNEEEINDLIAKNIKDKISRLKYEARYRAEVANDIIAGRATLDRIKEEMPKLIDRIKSEETKLFFLGEKMEIVMKKIVTLYKAKYSHWL